MTAEITSGDRVQHDPLGGLGTVEYVGPGENATRVNAHAALTARAEQAEAEVERLREALGQGKLHLLTIAHERASRATQLRTERDVACAERDAARAELAAANTTDGLGLPRVEVKTERHSTWVKSGTQAWTSVEDDFSTATLRSDAAVALALLRARLAQEAPTTKNEE